MNFSLIKKILNKIPLGNVILFESVPDLSDNTMPVFEEMVRRGLNQKYKMVWLVSDAKKAFPKIPNVVYIDWKRRWNRYRYAWYQWHSKALIYCNIFIGKKNKKQFGVYLTHGTALKDVGPYYNLEGTDFDYVITAGNGTNEFMAKALKISPDRCVGLGFPRNDVLTAPSKDLHSYFEGDFKKVIVWYPTFRQHKNGMATGSSDALPILHDTDSAMQLNAVAKEAGVLIVLKPHFAQDVSYIKDYNLSNLRFIDDSFFVANGLSSYEFVGSCDAMLSDYSSIYYDYLLCDKPIGVVWEDIEQYRQNPGFAVDVDHYMKGAEKIYTLSELSAFVCSVAKGEDRLKKERNEINGEANCSTDGQNARRVVDFIIEKANL